ncbi:MAG: hypothetical protein H6733_06940, partial [Alphaproteobacteria bacterium]|nr:hypothetical protein [Alphaproteobacteria bacterium]
IVLEVSCDAEHVHLTVIDQGPGVPEAMRERIFERFVQADASDGRARGGTGLGLPISRGLVERQGGTLTLEPVPGRTRFVVTLPSVGKSTPVL